MKKYIILLSIFVVVFIGLFITMKALDKEYGTGGHVISTGTGGGNDGNTALGSLHGEGITYEMGDSGSSTDNPEGDYVNQVAILIDGKFNEEDWAARRNAGLTNQAIATTMAECEGLYAYGTISTDCKQLYAEILLTMRGHYSDMPLCSIDANEIEKISSSVLLDHPELFYVDGYSYEQYMFAGNVQKIVYNANYTMNKTDVADKKAQIDQVVQHWLQGISQQASDYDKVKYVYECIIRNTEYNLAAPDNQNICSVFLGHESVCLGYAKSVQYLLQQLGMKCAVVTGSVITGEAHAWNLVEIDSQYYYVDATWGDASYLSDSGAADVLTTTNYDYLCITTRDLQKTHIIDNPVSVPNCTSLLNNYYVKEGLYLNNLESLTLERIFRNAYSDGEECVSIRCSDETVFGQVKEHLLDEQHIFQYLKNGTTSLTYTYNEELYTYTFML